MELPDLDLAGHTGSNGQHQPIFKAYSVLESSARESPVNYSCNDDNNNDEDDDNDDDNNDNDFLDTNNPSGGTGDVRLTAMSWTRAGGAVGRRRPRCSLRGKRSGRTSGIN